MKVLICDPSPTGVKILSEELTNLDIEVTLAEDGLEFIRLIFSENPDLIISESDIPVLSGLHIARYIRTNARFKKTKYFLFLASLSGRTEILAEDTVDGIFKKDELGFHLLMEAVRRMIPEIGTEVKDEIDDFAPRPEISEIIESLDMEFDSLIFRDLLRGKLLGIAEFNSSLELTLQKLLHIIGSFTNFNIAIVLLKIEKSVVSYIDPGNLSTTDTEDFLSICLEDFYSLFDRKELNQGEKIILKKNEANPSPENHKVSSYYFLELQTPSGLFGSIHLGYYRNNYYTETFSHVFKEFMKEANLFIQNAISMKVITEKESNLNKIFQKFVPSDIINDLLTKKSTFSLLTGEKRNVAILFSDIRSFTTLSENNPPEAVVAFLNSYFDIMCKIITDNGGTVDKFIGDAILAIFGAPKSYDDNSMRAVRSAIEMIQSLSDVKRGSMVLPNNQFQIGIGIHEGDVIVGNIGSKEKFEYTVIGDNVNLASRLEGLTKHYHQEIIISETIYKIIKSSNQSLRELDTVKVKGKDEPTKIYGVYSDPEARIMNPDILSNYKKGLAMYRIQNWNTAIEYFRYVLKEIPDDFISGMYLERCEKFKREPPSHWDGSIGLDFK